MRQYQLLDHLLEFKVLGLNAVGLSGEQVRARSREALRQLQPVRQALVETGEQLARYRQTLERIHGNPLKLRTHAVVCIGLERLVFASDRAE